MIFTKPAEIEQESMRIIAAELEARGIVIPEEERAVVMRVIHTTADFDYAANLRFTPDAASQGQAALRGRLGCTARCTMAEAFIAERARERGVTRAAVSVDWAAEHCPGAIFVIGNAPTALLRLAEHIENGLRPALVIGVPVGFVNVVESKERALAVCEKNGLPAIIALGRKGGSNVAAAICNALLYGIDKN